MEKMLKTNNTKGMEEMHVDVKIKRRVIMKKKKIENSVCMCLCACISLYICPSVTLSVSLNTSPSS